MNLIETLRTSPWTFADIGFGYRRGKIHAEMTMRSSLSQVPLLIASISLMYTVYQEAHRLGFFENRIEWVKPIKYLGLSAIACSCFMTYVSKEQKPPLKGVCKHYFSLLKLTTRVLVIASLFMSYLAWEKKPVYSITYIGSTLTSIVLQQKIFPLPKSYYHAFRQITPIACLAQLYDGTVEGRINAIFALIIFYSPHFLPYSDAFG